MATVLVRPARWAAVDDADLSLVSLYRWHFDGRYAKAYVKRDGRVKVLYMHRLILNAPRGRGTDHIDGDGLNNQRANLRLCSQTQNCYNKRKGRRASSRFKGVCRFKQTGRNPWKAEIRIYGYAQHLGVFSTEEGAALAYNEAAVVYFGEFAKLNRSVVGSF